MPESPEFQGPTIPTVEQVPTVVDLANHVFRANRSGDMGREYPTLFRRDALEQMRIILHEGRPVSHVGVVFSDVWLLGCRVRVASIGAVCTDPDFRGHGLAGRLMDDAIRHARSRGVSIMLISGDRTLYARRGAFHAGAFARYTIPAQGLPGLDGRTLEPVTADAPAVAREALRLFEAEPIRYLRDIDDYRMQLGSRNVMNRPGETILVRRHGRAEAVLSVNLPGCVPEQKDVLIVQEMAGSRLGVLAAAGAVAREHGAARVQVEAYAADLNLAAVADQAGAKREVAPFPGTVKILAASLLWRTFWPLAVERTTLAEAGAIEVTAQADDLAVHSVEFRQAGQSVTISGAQEVVSAFFDPHEPAAGGRPSPLAEAKGPLGDLLRKALPLPLPMYGLNYV